MGFAAAEIHPPAFLLNIVAAGTVVDTLAALAGAGLGTAIGRRWMSETATRHVLAAILLFTEIRRLLFK
jgi:hypothetical protein